MVDRLVYVPEEMPPPSVGDLQFNRAEFEREPPKLACAACHAEIPEEYYQLNGVPVCAACAGVWRAGQREPAKSDMMRGTLFGLGAALAGAVGMALIAKVTGLQFSLAAIGVGWLVGMAMRKGANGFGSRKCQLVAVALAYLGITLSYLPAIVKGLETGRVSKVILVVVALAAPVLELAGGINGILGLVILFFGLSQAWRMTGRDKRVLSGPFSTKPVEG
jgi:hypothetical protein